MGGASVEGRGEGISWYGECRAVMILKIKELCVVCGLRSAVGEADAAIILALASGLRDVQAPMGWPSEREGLKERGL